MVDLTWAVPSKAIQCCTEGTTEVLKGIQAADLNWLPLVINAAQTYELIQDVGIQLWTIRASVLHPARICCICANMQEQVIYFTEVTVNAFNLPAPVQFIFNNGVLSLLSEQPLKNFSIPLRT